MAFRHKWMIAIVFAAVTLGGLAMAMVKPDIYESRATIMLREARSPLAIDPGREQMVTSTQRFVSPSAGEAAILESADLAEEVLTEVGLERFLRLAPGVKIEDESGTTSGDRDAAMQVAVRRFDKSLSVEPDNQIIVVRYTDVDPQMAHDVLDKIILTYELRHIAAHSSSASPELLRQKVVDLDASLKAKRDELTAYQEEHDVSSATSQRETVEAQVNAFEAELAAARVNLKASEGKIQALEAALSGRGSDVKSAPMEIANPAVVALREQLVTLKAEEIRLKAIYVDSPELRANRRQIADTEAEIKRLPATVPRALGVVTEDAGADPAVQLEAERVEHQALLATEASLNEELRASQARLEVLRQHEWTVSNLEREVSHLSEQYWAARNGLELAETNAALDRDRVSNVSIVQPATTPDKPIGPRRGRMIALALFAGLALGLGLAFVREFFDDTVKSRDEIEKKLGMTVLAVVPQREFRKCI